MLGESKGPIDASLSLSLSLSMQILRYSIMWMQFSSMHWEKRIQKPWIQDKGGLLIVPSLYKSILVNCLTRANIFTTKYVIIQISFCFQLAERPLTVMGYKFDIRLFVLVTSLDPLVVFVNENFYLRFTSQPYSVLNLNDK